MNTLSDTQPATPDALSRVLLDVEEANGLPNEHYTSQAVFDEEREALLFETWTGVGFVSDVPMPGDAKPVELLGMPLLLVRDHEGGVGVFQNTCRHRGMILVAEPVNIRKVIRCPYHSWCYGLDGELQATPHVGGAGHNTHSAIKREELGLHRIASATYLGVVFVNVSGNAPPFETYAADLMARWSDFDTPLHHGGAQSSFSLDVRTNWKLAVENYCESYHLPWIHPGLNSYSKLQDHFHIEHPGAFSGQGSHVYRQLTDVDGSAFPDFKDLPATWNTAAEYIALYPNVLLGVHRDHVFAQILEPVALDRTTERVALFYTEQGAQDERFATLRVRNAALWRSVFEEDIQVVEGMQAGRHGRYFDGGRFSPAMDTPTFTFHRWVAERMRSHRAAGD